MKRYLCTVLLLSVLLSGCSGSTPPEESIPETTAAPVLTTEAPTTEPPTNAPFPEPDPNAVTFDEVGEEVAEIIADDEFAAGGTLSVESVDGNNMLKFTDTSTTADSLPDAVQKLRINVLHLIAPDDLEKIRSVEFDLYAQAKADEFVNNDGNHMTVPGWIGGGGGTETADGKWYGFSDFAASGVNEYNLTRSDTYRVSFKLLLAASGKKWDSSMDKVYFQIMRWGMQNLSDLYIDNITFYDENGESIPLTIAGSTVDAGKDDTALTDAGSTEMETT